MIKLLQLKKLVLYLLFLMPIVSFGQKITGKVIDSKNNPLQYATVTLINPQDSTLIGFASANKSGEFTLLKVPVGKNIFQINFVGFMTYQKEIDFKGENIDFRTIELQEGTELEEVIVSAYIPITIKEDTVAYSAKAFKVRIDETVEDLLKKLPGVEVDADGKVTAQGEEITKIYVNGKEFFSSDPTVATKNLSADAIKKIEVIDEKSDKARITGVNDSERSKVINLELKDDKQVNDFGKFQAGYGTENRYLTSLNYNRFTPKLQLSLVGKLNNVNSSGSDISDIMVFGGSNRRHGMFMSEPSSATGYLTTGIAGINLGYEIEKKKDFNVDYFYNRTDATSGDVFSKKTEFINDDEIYSESKSSDNNISNQHKANFSYINRASQMSSSEIRGSIQQKNSSSLSENSSERLNAEEILDLRSSGVSDSENEETSAKVSLEYVKRFSEESSRNIEIESDFNISQTNSIENNNQLYEFGLSDILTSYNSKQEISKEETNKDIDFDLGIDYAEPIAKNHFLEIETYGKISNSENSVNQSNIENDVMITPLNYKLFMQKTELSGGAFYKYDNDKLTIKAGVNYSSQNQNFGTKSEDEYTQTYNELNPELRIRYRPERGRFMYLKASKSLGLASLYQLSPIVDNFNALNITQGNINLTPSTNYSLTGMFVRHDFTSGFSIFSRLNYNYVTNNIINTETTNNLGVRTTSYTNYGDKDNMSISLNLRNRIEVLKMRYSLSLSGGFSNYSTIINEAVNQTNTKNGTVGLTLENDKKEKLDASIGASLSKDLTSFSGVGNTDRDYLQQSYFVKFDWNMTQRINFNSQFKYDIYTDSNFGTDQSVPIWNASLSYSFLKNKSLNLKITALDILNKSIGLTRTSSDNYFQEIQKEVLGTYYMLSLTYNLNGNKNPNANKRGPGQGRGRH